MALTIALASLPSQPVAVIRHQAHAAELARVIPDSCGRVWRAVRAQQVAANRHVAIYWDQSIQLEVGVEVGGAFVDDGQVVRSATPAGWVARATHLGPYGALGQTHAAVRAWCAAHQHRLAGPHWEIYEHFQPEWTTRPSAIRTDVHYLIVRDADR